MSDHLSAERTKRYRLRTLSPPELLDFFDHLAACAPCRERLAVEEGVRAAVIALAADLRAGATGIGRLPREEGDTSS